MIGRIPSVGIGVVWLTWLLVGGTELARSAQVEDTHSYSRPDQVRVSHVSLKLTVDFARKVLLGDALLSVVQGQNSPPGAPLILDTRGLEIQGVTIYYGEHGDALPVKVTKFSLGAPDPIKGRALRIELPQGFDPYAVRVRYETTAKSTALQWLEPSMTAGKKQPFLFTQSEAIHARTWIPCQDSPGVRVTYDAEITVPDGLTAVMSATQLGNEVRDGKHTFRFTQKQKIPAYLIALAVGDLAFQPLRKRTGVFAEPSVVGAAASEFVDTEKMVETIEKRFGPYRWGRYDLLVLPPSFPFGGMENPMLTFATPTILAGDRSLVSLVAHELAHSWSGNLVTNATWRDFWLNEGFTSYLERRVMEDLYGTERAAMERVLGLKELREDLKTFAPRDQILDIDVDGRDPDEGMTRIPYEKGALLLDTLEHAFGRARFDAFLRAYFDNFAFQSITTADFEAYLREHLLKTDERAAATINLKAWLYEPGLPVGYPVPMSDRFLKVEEVARDWSKADGVVDPARTKGWTTHEWVHFLQSLPPSVPTARLTALDQAYQLTARGNAEVLQQWLLIAIRNGYVPAYERVESFLTTVGRRKFLVPLYAELMKTPEGAERARAIFAKARAGYHPIAVDSVEKVLAGAKSR